MEYVVFLGPPFLAFALMGAAHYWSERIKGSPLHQLQAYMIGCVFGIMLEMVGWSWWWNYEGYPFLWWYIPLELWLCIVGAGIGTMFSYALDALYGERAKYHGIWGWLAHVFQQKAKHGKR